VVGEGDGCSKGWEKVGEGKVRVGEIGVGEIGVGEQSEWGKSLSGVKV